MEVGFIGLTVAKVSMTTAALSLAYTCLEVFQCTELLTTDQ